MGPVTFQRDTRSIFCGCHVQFRQAYLKHRDETLYTDGIRLPGVQRHVICLLFNCERQKIAPGGTF
jgi:hypothetical protein